MFITDPERFDRIVYRHNQIDRLTEPTEVSLTDIKSIKRGFHEMIHLVFCPNQLYHMKQAQLQTMIRTFCAGMMATGTALPCSFKHTISEFHDLISDIMTNENWVADDTWLY